MQVALVTLNGGERVSNTPYALRWTAQAATSFDVELSRNSGATFVPIPGCTAFPASARDCVWMPTTPISTTALIRVTATDNGGAILTDTSDALSNIRNGTPSVWT